MWVSAYVCVFVSDFLIISKLGDFILFQLCNTFLLFQNIYPYLILSVVSTVTKKWKKKKKKKRKEKRLKTIDSNDPTTTSPSISSTLKSTKNLTQNRNSFAKRKKTNFIFVVAINATSATNTAAAAALWG